jgi:hypothetical protein
MTRITAMPLNSAELKKNPLWRGLFLYFWDALIGAARISFKGNEKHNPGQPMHHARGKSADHGDCILRHLVDSEIDYGHGVGIEPIFDEQGNLIDTIPFVDQLVWRAMAYSQEWHEKHRGATPPPLAKFPDPVVAAPAPLIDYSHEIPLIPSGTFPREQAEAAADDIIGQITGLGTSATAPILPEPGAGRCGYMNPEMSPDPCVREEGHIGMHRDVDNYEFDRRT